MKRTKHTWKPFEHWDGTGGFVKCDHCKAIAFLTPKECLKYARCERRYGVEKIRISGMGYYCKTFSVMP